MKQTACMSLPVSHQDLFPCLFTYTGHCWTTGGKDVNMSFIYTSVSAQTIYWNTGLSLLKLPDTYLVCVTAKVSSTWVMKTVRLNCAMKHIKLSKLTWRTCWWRRWCFMVFKAVKTNSLACQCVSLCNSLCESVCVCVFLNFHLVSSALKCRLVSSLSAWCCFVRVRGQNLFKWRINTLQTDAKWHAE